MTDEEYQAMVARIQSGALLIGVDRAMARKFYTDVPLSRIVEATGQAPYFEKIVVLVAFGIGPIALLASVIIATLTFGWWGVLIIPASIAGYFIFAGASSMPKQGMAGVTTLLVLALLGLYLGWFPSEYVGWYVVLTIFALWNARLVYSAATHFIRAFVTRNRRAFEFLDSHIHLREASNYRCPVGLFDFIDSRKGIARWAVRFYQSERARDPNLAEAVIVQLAIDARYRVKPLPPKQQAIVDGRRPKVRTIHELCELVVEAELLHDIGIKRLLQGSSESTLAARTHSVVHAELERLGFKHPLMLEREREKKRVQDLKQAGLQIGQSRDDVLIIMGRRPDREQNIFPEPGKTILRWTYIDKNGPPVVIEFSKLRVSSVSRDGRVG